MIDIHIIYRYRRIYKNMKHIKKICAVAMAIALGVIAAAIPAKDAYCMPKVLSFTTGQPEQYPELYTAYDAWADRVGQYYGEAAKQAWITAEGTGDFGPLYQAIGSVSPVYLDTRVYGESNISTAYMLEKICYEATGKTGTVPFSQVLAKSQELGYKFPSDYSYFASTGKAPALAPTVTTDSIKSGAAAPASNTASTTQDPGFDATAYASRYPDLAKAGLTTPEQLYQHWITYGKKEGRNASK